VVVAPGFADNTLGVLGYPGALAFIDIAAMEPPPTARRFEVYGSRGGAILEPFEPARAIWLCLVEAAGERPTGAQWVTVRAQSRQELYELELRAFVVTLRGKKAPDRTLDHELRVQETLLRLTGSVRCGAIAPGATLPFGGSSLFGPLGSSAFRLFRHPLGNVARGSALLFGISRLALPAWDQGDGAEQSACLASWLRV
jgi:hypothetical protein